MKDEGGARELRARLRDYAVRVMRVGDSLPRSRSANVIAYQLIKAGTSVGAHYREGSRARSDAEVISKLETALQELDETDYWLELLRSETNELLAILVTCVKNVKSRSRR